MIPPTIRLIDVLSCVELLGFANAQEVRFLEDGTLAVTVHAAVTIDDMLVALQALGVDTHRIIRGTLVVNQTEVRWTEVVLDRRDRPAIRNGRYVITTRRIRVQP